MAPQASATDGLGTRLLACLERLVTASEASAKGLTALETRSTGRIEKELDGLIDCANLLILSQAASMKALNGLLNDETSFKTLEESLQQCLTLAKVAAERLRGS